MPLYNLWESIRLFLQEIRQIEIKHPIKLLWGVKELIRVGVVGTGYMGGNHVRIYSEMEDVKLTGISDTNTSRVKEITARYNTMPFADHKKMFKKTKLDAINIAAPTTLHCPIVLDALEAGVDVLVEKPIADSVENAATMIESAEEMDRHLMVGHIERFNPVVLKLKEIIDSGALGKIVSVSTRRVDPYNPRIRCGCNPGYWSTGHRHNLLYLRNEDKPGICRSRIRYSFIHLKIMRPFTCA